MDVVPETTRFPRILTVPPPSTLNSAVFVVAPLSIMNAFAGDSLVENEFIDSFIAGCSDLSPNWLDKLTGSEQAELEVRAIDDVTQQTIATIKAPENFKIYFPNDVTKLQTIFDIDYELHNSGVPNNVTYQGEPQYKSASDKYPEAARTFYDGVSYGLNTQTVNILDKSYYGWTSVQYLADFAQLIVGECIDYCGENLSKTVGGALKIHFGVEGK